MKSRQIEKLRRCSIKTGIRVSKKLHHALNREEVLALRVQILPLAPRIFMGCAALFLILAAIFSWPSDSNILCALEVIGGLLLFFFAIFGIRSTLSSLGDHLSYEAFELIVEAVLSAAGSAVDL